MAHPFNEYRAHKVEKERVPHIAGKAAGGTTHSDVAADKALVHKMVKAEALRADGGAIKARADRSARAYGGKVNKKGTTVNVIVERSGGVERPAPSVAPPPVAPPPAPAVPPRPPMMAPPGGGAPGVGMPPPMRAKGGRVKTAPSDEVAGVPRSKATKDQVRDRDGRDVQAEDYYDAEKARELKSEVSPVIGRSNSRDAGIGRGRTLVQHTDNKHSELENIGRKASITKAKGGGVSGVHGADFSDGRTGKQMGPTPPGGGGGGAERLWAAKRLKSRGE